MPVDKLRNLERLLQPGGDMPSRERESESEYMEGCRLSRARAGYIHLPWLEESLTNLYVICNRLGRPGHWATPGTCGHDAGLVRMGSHTHI
jgi:hypothetical protein